MLATCAVEQPLRLSYFDPARTTRRAPPAGHGGCAAEVVEVQPARRRSNILSSGGAYAPSTSRAATRTSSGASSSSRTRARDAHFAKRGGVPRVQAHAGNADDQRRPRQPELPESEPERLSSSSPPWWDGGQDKQELLELRSPPSVCGDYTRCSLRPSKLRGRARITASPKATATR